MPVEHNETVDIKINDLEAAMALAVEQQTISISIPASDQNVEICK
jgi:hypothetical protein